jgi:hypothetical protein
MEGPAETTVYMIAGYAVIFGVLFIYITSLWVRHVNLSRDEATLRDLEREDQS